MLFQSPHNSWIDPVELRMPALSYAQSSFKRWKTECQKSILKDVNIPGNSGPRYARVPRKSRNIDHLPVKQGGNRQEPGKAGEVAYDCFRLDFLFEVQLDISAKGFLPGLGLPDDWKAPVLQDILQREI